MSERAVVTLKHVVTATDTLTACDLLAQRSGLSKSKIKDAMNKGAVWLAPARGAMKRLRRATATLRAGERIELHYNAEVLARSVPPAPLLADRGQFSVWCKPASMLAQGTFEGDHCALLRQAELHFKPPRPALLVHRLDREASGVMLVAHSRDAAARLSRLFEMQQVRKRYRVDVRGRPAQEHGRIDTLLDGKPALTDYAVLAYDAEHDIATLDVRIATGRLHQIRRHCADIGHGVIGDPKYGRGNKDPGGLRLVAVSLAFRCPFTGRDVEFDCPPP